MSFHEGVPHRAGSAKDQEAKWRAESLENSFTEYGKVQEELKKLTAELDENIEKLVASKELTLEERERSLQANRNLSQRIEKLEQRKTELEVVLRKAGGNPNDHTVQ